MTVNNDLDDIFEEDWPEDHRSGVVAIFGRPNVGKSTLLNRILGQKIAIVTDTPQTTRKQQIGIYTEEKGQILFVDTPGLHKPHHKLGEYMVGTAQTALRDADALLWVLDASKPPARGDTYIAETLKNLKTNVPVILALNKCDLVEGNIDTAEHETLITNEQAVQISAQEGTGVPELLQVLLAALPLGPRYYPADQISEVNLRFIAAEIIREKIILNTSQELPHSVAVAIESFKERDNGKSYVEATIYVERESQKGIIIGKGGEMIRRIGTTARQDINAHLGVDSYLDLHVKVLKNWRSKNNLLRRLGYALPKQND